jgi:hypothetical protein
MIVFDLRCGGGHVFEAWFGSTADFDEQCARGMIACPLCGDGDIAKAVMAPAVAAKGNRSPTGGPGRPGNLGVAATEPQSAHAALLAAQRRMEAESDYVGGAFAAQARARHDDGQASRPIYGEATSEEARALLEDGIPVLPLPFRPLVRSDA